MHFMEIFELIHNLYHLELLRITSNYLINGIPNTIPRKKKINKTLQSKIAWNKFSCNMINKTKIWNFDHFQKLLSLLPCPMTLVISMEIALCDILRKNNRFDLKLGELINLIFWFCEDKIRIFHPVWRLWW